MSLINSTRIALPFAQQLAERGKALSLPSNSDFVPLVRAAVPDSTPEGEVAQTAFLGNLYLQSDTLCGVNEFEEISGGIKDSLVHIVRDHIRIAQEVTGIVVEGVSKVNKYREALPDSSAIGRFTIIQDPLPEVFESNYFQDTIMASTPSVVRRPTMALVSRPRTNDELLALLVTDNSELSNGLNQAFSYFALNDYGRPRNVLEDIFMGFFCSFESQAKFYNFSEFQKLPTGERLTVAFAVYLLAEALLKTTPSDAVGTLHDFTENCKNAMSVMHSSMLNAFNEKKYQVQNGILVINLHHSDSSAVVDKSSYTAFLEAGGSPELVLGAKVAYLPFYSAKELAENAEKCITAWNHYALLNNSVVDNELQAYLRATYKAVYSELGESGPEFETALRKENMSMFGEGIKIAYEWIDNQDLKSLEDVQGSMEYLIGMVRFGYTPAALFMKHMAANRRKNPDAGSREDALVATVKYLAAYVLTQIRAVNV